MFSVNQANGLLGIYDKLSLVDGYEPKAGDTATITATALNEDNKIYSPNFTVTYTLEIVDALPEISRTLASDTFEYPEDNKSNQDVTFKNIVEIKNLKDGYKVVPFVTEASDNVGYTNSLGEYNLSGMTVDATGLELVEEANGRYSIIGIKVASASKVREDTYISVGLLVFDADGNLVSGSSKPIYLYIKGEKPVEITFENTMSVVKINNKKATYIIKDWDGYSNGISNTDVKVTDENGTTIGTALVGDEILEVTFNKAVEKNEVRNFKIDIPVFKEYNQHFVERTVTVSLTAENPSLTFEETTVFEDNGSVTYTLKDSNGWKIKETNRGQCEVSADGTSFTFTPDFSESNTKNYNVLITFEKNGVTVSREYKLTALKSPKIELENSVVEVDENGTATISVNSDNGWKITPSIDSSIGNIVSFENGELTFKLETDFTDTKKIPITFSCSKQLDENTTLSATKKIMVTLTKTQTGEDGGEIDMS